MLPPPTIKKVKRPQDPHAFTGFDANQRGGLTTNRQALHESEGYQRQIRALVDLQRLGPPMSRADSESLKAGLDQAYRGPKKRR